MLALGSPPGYLGYDLRALYTFAAVHRLELPALSARFDLIDSDIQSYERVNTAIKGCEIVLPPSSCPAAGAPRGYSERQFAARQVGGRDGSPVRLTPAPQSEHEGFPDAMPTWDRPDRNSAPAAAG